MAKTKHNKFIDTVNEISEDAKTRGLAQLYTEDERFTGRHIHINGRKLCHFGTTSYLGLDQDERLKEAAANAIWDYGTQFPLSKTYLSHTLYAKLENQLEEMYGYPAIVMKNSTLGHLGVIPTVVRDEDTIVLDHQVHWSVQNAAQLCRSRGVRIEMIRHNDLGMLEDCLKNYASKQGKIWYFADGIYSMFGDEAPIEELMTLSDKYPQLHLYFDDVHGMSWIGEHGTGFVKSHFPTLPENVILVCTLSKTFGASGSFMVTANKHLYNQVRNFGGPLTFSAQLEPASVAAASASAAIHLSREIYGMQRELASKIRYCNRLLRDTSLPIIEWNECPVFFIGAGAPSIGFKLTKRLFDEGFYTNIGTFPAVPVKNTGIRFTLCRHNKRSDIKGLVDCLSHHHPIVLEEEGYAANKVRKFFNLPLIYNQKQVTLKSDLQLEIYNDIHQIKKEEWNRYFGSEGLSDYDGLVFMQSYFTGRDLLEENWDFRYVMVKDQNQKVIIATYFTNALWKDDTLAAAHISMEVEKGRAQDPYYMTSKVLSIGSLITEGKMFYLDKSHPEWQKALTEIFVGIEKIDEELNPSMITLRDFYMGDSDLKRVFFEKGFIKIDMPDSCFMERLNWTEEEGLISLLSSKSRRNFRKDVAPYIDQCVVEVTDQLPEHLADHCYQLVRNVWKKNFDINVFLYDSEFFRQLSDHPRGEVILLYLKDENGDLRSLPSAALYCYRSAEHSYVPVLIGIDYNDNEAFSIYRQMLYHTIERARALKCTKINFGFSAAFEKKKLGSSIVPTHAYIQAKDNYSMEMMGIIQKGK